MVTSGPVVAEQVVKVDEPRRRMASMAGSPSQLESATRDLFRLAGGQSIPVEARVPADKPKPAPAAARKPDPAPASSASSSKKTESSVLFSLESLMKAAGGNKPQNEHNDEIDQQLWNMQAETPLFGTSLDHALLTTPLDPPPGSAPMDPMTMSSRRPAGMRTSLLLGLGTAGAIVLAGVGWFVLRPSGDESPAAALALEAPGREGSTVPGKEPPAAAAHGAGGEEEAKALRPAGEGARTAEAAGSEPNEAAKAEPAVASDTGSEDADKAGSDETEKDKSEDAEKPAASDKRVAASKPAATPRSTKKAPARATKALAPFNVGAAKDALNAAAARASKCIGTSGKGKVQLTFTPSGKVSSAKLTEGPFAGTTAGKCALRHFRAASVPPFAGSAQTVAKSFKIP